MRAMRARIHLAFEGPRDILNLGNCSFGPARAPRALLKAPKYTPAPAVCNRCYTRWYYNLNIRRDRPVSTGDVFRGSAASYLEAADAEDRRVFVLLAAMGDVGADKIFLAKENIQVACRARVLRDSLGDNQPVKLSDLSDLHRQMIEADPICKD